MYEHRDVKPAPTRRFLRRLAVHLAVAASIVAASLLLGMWGYSRWEGLDWRDAFLNAAMLLGGMGPVDAPRTPGGKVFAGLYALYSGLVFLVAAGIVFAPLLHRLLHRFHWVDEPERRR
jgi:sterol desaturase/sphingolipid hydroxylase (fatty acid hydroxylase superfamily)